MYYIFKEGIYYLCPRIGIHNVRMIIDDSRGLILRPPSLSITNNHYADRRPGFLSPLIPWRIL